MLLHTDTGGYQFVSDHVWAQSLGISWFVGVDGISLFLVLLAAVLFPIALAGARVRENARAFVAWMLLLEAACIGTFISLDLIMFFLFFELTLVPAYFLISGWGYTRRAYAAVKFFIYTFFGSAFLLVGILALAFVHQSQSGVLTFSLPALEHTHLSGTTGVLLFLAFTAAFAVKAPLFPFHTWSPDAYTEAPTGGLDGARGGAGQARHLRHHPLRPEPVPAGLQDAGARCCSRWRSSASSTARSSRRAQRDLKRLVAYSSLAQIGFIVLGTFAFTTEGLTGGVLLMVNHGLITAALFLLIGLIADRRSTWQVSGLRGLQHRPRCWRRSSPSSCWPRSACPG